MIVVRPGTSVSRALGIAALLVLGACEPPIKSGDAGVVGHPDLALVRDQGSDPPPEDGGASDDAAAINDLKKVVDQSGAPDASWGTCTANGVAGECISTTDCAAQGKVSTAGLCPGPSNIRCCTEALNPADGGTSGAACPSTSYPTPNDGKYASPGEVVYDGLCPAGMVPVGTFCIDKFEASVYPVDAADDDVVIGSWSPFKNPGSTRVRAASIAGAIPQGYINQLQAKAACEVAKKRLCTNDEWRSACRGPDDFTYPYGNTRIDDRCNDESDRVKHPVVECFNSTDNSIWSKLSDPGISQQPMTVDPAGTRAQCLSPYDVNDMMGNLHEWTSDPAGTFQGGFYFDTTKNGNGCLYRTTAHDVSHWDYSTGFRCCK